MDDHQVNRAHRAKRKTKTIIDEHAVGKHKNPRAFGFYKASNAIKGIRRTLDIESTRRNLPKARDVTAKQVPITVAVFGPPGCGKSTLIRSIVNKFVHQRVEETLGPITITNGRGGRFTFFEATSDAASILDLCKVADIAFIMINGQRKQEMETFEALDIMKSIAMPVVMTFLSHTDLLTPLQRKNTRKLLKKRMQHEVARGVRFFELEGLRPNGTMYKTGITDTIARFLNQTNPKLPEWRRAMAHLLADRAEILNSSPEKPTADVALCGWVRGTALPVNGMAHFVGAGDFEYQAYPMADPCPLDTVKAKRRRLGAVYKALFAPWTDVGSVTMNPDATFTHVPIDSGKLADEISLDTNADDDDDEPLLLAPDGAVLAVEVEQSVESADDDTVEDPNLLQRPVSAKSVDDFVALAPSSGTKFGILDENIDSESDDDLLFKTTEGPKVGSDRSFIHADSANDSGSDEDDGLDDISLKEEFPWEISDAEDDGTADDLDSDFAEDVDDDEIKSDDSQSSKEEEVQYDADGLPMVGDLEVAEAIAEKEKEVGRALTRFEVRQIRKRLLLRHLGVHSPHLEKLKEEVAALETAEEIAISHMRDDERRTITGFTVGEYSRIVLRNVPIEIVNQLSLSQKRNIPLILAAISSEYNGPKLNRVRFLRHRWYPRQPNSADPIIVSTGWYRFQTIPIFARHDDYLKHHADGERMRFIKVAPEYQHCEVVYYGPSAPPGSAFLSLTTLGRSENFCISGTGTVLESKKSFKVVKKLRLKGEPVDIKKRTAFVSGMFTSQLEAAKFLNSKVKTVSGIRGAIKAIVTSSHWPAGTVRCTFEDRIVRSDIVFLNSWVEVPVKQWFNPLFTLAGDVRLMRTRGEMRSQLGLRAPHDEDSVYKPVIRKEKKAPRIHVSDSIQRNLPFASRMKVQEAQQTRYLRERQKAVVLTDTQKARTKLLHELGEIYGDKFRREQNTRKASRLRKASEREAEAKAIDMRRKKARTRDIQFRARK